MVYYINTYVMLRVKLQHVTIPLQMYRRHRSDRIQLGVLTIITIIKYLVIYSIYAHLFT